MSGSDDPGVDPAVDDPGADPVVDDPGGEEQRGSRLDAAGVTTYIRWGGLFALGLLVVVSTARLYGSLSAVVDIWVASRYQPFANAALNFGVLCAATAGIVVLLRRG